MNYLVVWGHWSDDLGVITHDNRIETHEFSFFTVENGFEDHDISEIGNLNPGFAYHCDCNNILIYCLG